MIKNYLISAVRPIANGSLHEKDSELHLRYYEMYKMSLASCKHFLQEDFEPILFTEPCKDVYELTKLNWYKIKELWHKEPCNIFWLGADTLMIKPTKIFNRFKEFRMFNYTDPKKHKQIEHYLNDDSRIFPHTMDPKLWDLGEIWWEQSENHPEKNWGFDQMRHNAMFWSQNIDFDDVFHPELNFMCGPLNDLNNTELINHLERWNNCKFEDAHILHLQGTWGSHKRIEFMQQLCKKLGISL